ncbi:hypothetical protein FSARC_10645 [Fusarium sarcochroum]|uniref:Uncharacterized protein n=1 Tax=Fusarium sarcochroum TaxID=1208366 RepID=A0A8H4TKW1_9HYPO|nr:hypothetical protein FSARC_10645 [Fusarium sarcochroum]
MSQNQLRGLSRDRMQLLSRQLSRNITRDGLSTVISGILACTMPWLLLPGILNVASFVKNISVLHHLKKTMRDVGMRVKKRVIAKGMIEGALIKFASTVITLGHEDLVTVTGAVSSWLNHVGAYIADHLSCSFLPSLHFNPQPVIDWDSTHRMSHHALQHTTKIAGWPTDLAQGLTNTDHQKSLGWRENSGDLAKQVLVVGSVEAAWGKVTDIVLEDPYHKAMDSSWSRRQRSKIRSWFRR